MTLKHTTKLFVISLFSLIFFSDSFAGTNNAILNGRSIHLNSTYDWNENNYGLGIEHEFDSSSAWRTTLMANGLRDSTESMSYMVGAGLHRRLFESERLFGFYVSAGLNAFVMTRDDVNNGRPFPGILPSISIGNQKFGVNLTYLPRKALEETMDFQVVDPTLSGLLFLQFKVSLDQLTP